MAPRAITPRGTPTPAPIAARSLLLLPLLDDVVVLLDEFVTV
jgi:hypothetical protein